MPPIGNYQGFSSCADNPLLLAWTFLAEHKLLTRRLCTNQLVELFPWHLEADAVEPVGNSAPPPEDKHVEADTAEKLASMQYKGLDRIIVNFLPEDFSVGC